MPAVHTKENDINKKCLALHTSKKIFMPVGKSASTSVKKALLQGKEQTELVTKDEILRGLMEYEKVTVVRNPFERLVSCYTFFTTKQKKFRYKLNIEFSTFEEFIKEVHQVPDEISNCHFRSQYNLLSQDNIFLPDIVVKLERIEEVLSYLPIEKLGRNPKTESSHGHYSTYYDDELVSLVEERFRKDLEVFKYEFSEA